MLQLVPGLLGILDQRAKRMNVEQVLHGERSARACVRRAAADDQLISDLWSAVKQDRQISAESLGVAHGVVGDVDAVPSRCVGVAGQPEGRAPAGAGWGPGR